MMLSICLAMLETEQDQQRFMRLFDAYEKKIYAVALLILEDQTQAEDAAQQTWLKLVQNWERISALPWKETGGYVVTTAKNSALNIPRLDLSGGLIQTLSQVRTVGANDLPVPPPAVLQHPVPCGVIHIGQAKAGIVALRPFEVVRQGPLEIPPDIRALVNGALQRPEIPG